MLAAVLSCALEICVRRTVPRPVCLWLVGGALCNAWLLLLCWRCDWIQCRQRACSIHQSLYQGMRFTVVSPIFAAQGMSCCCLSVQNFSMIGRTGFRESTGIFWAHHACLEPNHPFVQSHSVPSYFETPCSMHPGFQGRDRPFVASSSSALKYTVLSTP